MRSITLYKIVDSNGNGNYQALQAYRFYSDRLPTLPKNILMTGLSMSYNMDDTQYERFADQLMDVFEQHNALQMLEKWTDINDPTFVTVSVCMDNILLTPDFHNNLTSWKTHPDIIKQYYQKLLNVVKTSSSQEIQGIDFDNKWYDECIRSFKEMEIKDKILSDLLANMKRV
jgi:hypothetical protein